LRAMEFIHGPARLAGQFRIGKRVPIFATAPGLDRLNMFAGEGHAVNSMGGRQLTE